MDAASLLSELDFIKTHADNLSRALASCDTDAGRIALGEGYSKVVSDFMYYSVRLKALESMEKCRPQKGYEDAIGILRSLPGLDDRAIDSSPAAVIKGLEFITGIMHQSAECYLATIQNIMTLHMRPDDEKQEN